MQAATHIFKKLDVAACIFNPNTPVGRWEVGTGEWARGWQPRAPGAHRAGSCPLNGSHAPDTCTQLAFLDMPFPLLPRRDL